MKFQLKAVGTLNREVTAAEFQKIVDEANGELLLRGVPSGKEAEGARLEARVAGPNVFLTITSGRYARAHDALLRLVNFFKEKLGRAFKTGFKSLEIESYVVDGVELPMEALQQIVLPPLVKRIGVEGKEASIEFQGLTIDLLRKGVVENVMELVVDKIKQQHYEGKGEMKEYTWRSAERPMLYSKDPAEELEARGWMRRAHGKGQWVYGVNFTLLVTALKALFREHVYEPLGFKEMIFPKFEPWAVPMASGHAKSIYPDAYFVAVPKVSTPKAWEDITDHFRVFREVPTEKILGKTASVGIMSYAQCPPFWQYLDGKTLADESLPLRIYDWSGPTYRNEAGGTSGITRLEEFHRIETMFIGYPEQVKIAAKEFDEAVTKLLDQVLEIEFRKCKVKPWWMAQERSTEETVGLEVGTIDYDAYLPFRGSKEEAEWLEIQNVSVIGEKYPKAFGVKAQKGDLWSGCAGTGIQRWIVTLLSQKGFDPANWPAAMREKIALAPDVKFV